METIITAIITAAATISVQLIKSFIDNKRLKKEKEENLKEQEKINVTILRHFITNIYYQYKDLQSIPENQKENLLYLYDLYTSLGGNSYIHSMIAEIEDWSVY